MNGQESMDPERWRQLENLYHATLEQEPAFRTDYLSEACAGDSALRREVESLIAHAEGNNRLDRPAWQGARVGPYEVLEKIGSGGMGEVWKARDTRLNRIVAIKWLRARFSERLEREARAVAALSHPHICTLYDVGPDYLVMEYIEGTPPKGPLPLGQALLYASQILEALEAAHRGGIVHRDLKPANILVGKQGVKLLDFGLARRIASPRVDEGAATATGPITEEGVMVGTPQYMAPEQLEGREPDARSDIFAFGCVLYELLTGKPAFEGKTPASLVAAILRVDPAPVSVMQPAAQAALSRVVDGCLAKNPDERWQSATDVRRALLLAGESQNLGTRPDRRRWIVPAVAVVALSLLAAAAGYMARPKVEPRPVRSDVVRFIVAEPDGAMRGTSDPLALSPNGRMLAFVAREQAGKSYIWLRDISSTTLRRLDGTEGAGAGAGYQLDGLMWSPDSREIAFPVGSNLKRIAISGGSPQVVCKQGTVRTGGFGSWHAEAGLIFDVAGTIYRASPDGGTCSVLLEPDTVNGETALRAPQFLPDGRRYIYLVLHSDRDKTGIYMREVGNSRKQLLVQTRSKAEYVVPGFLLFLRDGTLLAQRLNPADSTPRGEPLQIAHNVGGPFGFSASAAGALAYRSVRNQNEMQVFWYTSHGDRRPAGGERGYIGFRLSPDHKRLALRAGPDHWQRHETLIGPLWVLELDTGRLSRVPLDASVEVGGLGPWTADGRGVVVSSRNASEDELRTVWVDSGASALLFARKAFTPMFPKDWSPDGGHLLFHEAWGAN